MDGNGVLTRWDGQPGRAGGVGLPRDPTQVNGVGLIALDTLTAGFEGITVTTVLTAVTNAANEPLLIAWTADPAHGFTRMADASAGHAIDLGVTGTVTSAGVATVLVSMRQGEGNLKVIAFELLGQADAMVWSAPATTPAKSTSPKPPCSPWPRPHPDRLPHQRRPRPHHLPAHSCTGGP